MSKYRPLSEHLAARTGNAWSASFAEVEAVLGFPLPKAARAGRAWWADDPAKSHSLAWTQQGWDADVDPAGERVVFRRSAPAAEIQPPAMKAPAEAAARKPLPIVWMVGVVALAAGLTALVRRRR
jgi:hypothetical protein